MPSLDAATVCPGQCLLEGINLSEGRATTRPVKDSPANGTSSTIIERMSGS
jgi:uncharacterized protein YbbC (DUF1343 family)